MQTYRMGTSRKPEYRYIVLVASEALNVILDPLEKEDLVVQA